MKSKKIKPFLIVFAILFILLYIVLAAKPLNKEYQYVPEWKISTASPVTQEIPADSKKMYFKLGKTIGYFSPEGSISLYSNYTDKAAISDSYYSLYSADSSNNEIYNDDGQLLGVLETDGYPFFDKQNIFVFLPGGTSYAKCNSFGKVLWNIENTMPITAFASTEAYTASGYADGQISVINNDTGKAEFSYSPGGSDFPVILGIDISPDGQYIASISGHNKQRFVLAQKELTQPKILFHTFSNGDLNTRTFVKFIDDGKKVLYNFDRQLGIYSIEDKSNSFLNLDKKIVSVEEAEDSFFLLGKKDNHYTVYILDGNSKLSGSFSFDADTAFIRATDDKLFIGKDQYISCINLSKN